MQTEVQDWTLVTGPLCALSAQRTIFLLAHCEAASGSPSMDTERLKGFAVFTPLTKARLTTRNEDGTVK